LNTQNSTQIQSSEIFTIAKGAGIVFIGTIFGTLLKYLFELIVSRQLGPKLFGVFFLAFTIFKVLERLSIVGLHNGVLRYVALFQGEGDKERIKGTILLSIKIVLFVGIVVTIFLFIFSTNISIKIFQEINLISILKILSLGMIFTCVTEILVYSIQAFKIMKYKMLVRMIFEPGTRIFFVIIGFLFGWRLFGAAFAFLTSIVLGTFLAFYYLRKIFPQITKKKFQPIYETKRIIGFSWPLFFVGFLNLFLIQINILMLGHFKTSWEVGIFGAAQRTAFLIPIILESFSAIFAPMISDYYNRKEFKKLENLFKIVTKWIFTFSFPLFLLMIFFSKEILSIWGREYIGGTISLIVICCAQLINCSVGPVGYMIMMTGRTKINLLNTIIVFTTIIGLNILLIPKYGILGAALSLATAIGFINIIRVTEVYLILKIHPYRFDFLKPLLAGCSALGILFLINNFVKNTSNNLSFLTTLFFIFICIYFLLLYLLKINKEDKLIFNYIKTKLLMRKS